MIWQRAASHTQQSKAISSRSRRFALLVLLTLLVEVTIFALTASAQRKVIVRPAAMPATLLQMNSAATLIVFKARGHRWKRDISLAALLKAGK